MRAPLTSGVRLLVALNVSYMAHLWPLMLQRLVRFVGNDFFGTQPLFVFQGTDLTGFAGHNLVARPSLNLAVCPSAACSPPMFANVPHAIASSRAVLRRMLTGVFARRLGLGGVVTVFDQGRKQPRTATTDIDGSVVDGDVSDGGVSDGDSRARRWPRRGGTGSN